MGLRKKFFALTYDRQLAKVEKAGLAGHRQKLLANVSGNVLEVGAGTGANIPFYGSSVESLTITEPDSSMLRRVQRRVNERAPDAKVVQAPVENLPFEDGTFDTVVSTLVLCGVDDQPRAVRELRRVLRPGGRFVFIEHVRSDDPKLARWQDRLNGLSRFVACCNCNRQTLSTIEAAGFQVVDLEHTTLPKAPPFVRPLIVGTATAPAH